MLMNNISNFKLDPYFNDENEYSLFFVYKGEDIFSFTIADDTLYGLKIFDIYDIDVRFELGITTSHIEIGEMDQVI